MACITVIPKPGKDLSHPSHYRPISLLSNLGKLYEAVVLLRLSKETDRLKVLPHVQFGFRPGHSTTQQLLRLMEFLTLQANEQKIVLIAALDVNAAFDKVDHDILLHRMDELGYSSNLLAIITAYLTARSFTVKIDGKFSSFHHILAGVPQGSRLSAHLYAVFTHDAPNNPDDPDEFTGLYADDIVKAAAGFTVKEASDKLEKSVNTTVEWGRKIRMCFNSDKTQLLEVNLHNRCIVKRPPSIIIDGTRVVALTTLKYLGLLFDSRLNFLAHAKAQAVKVNAKFRQVKMLYPWSPRSLPIARTLFLSLVSSIVIYGGAAYLATATQQAISVLSVRETTCLRYFLPHLKMPHSKKNPLNTKLYEEIDVLPLQQRLHVLLHQELQRIKNHDNPLLCNIGKYDDLSWSIRRPGDVTPPSTIYSTSTDEN